MPLEESVIQLNLRALLLAAPLTACGAWPTANHLPDAGTWVAADTDPRALVVPEWVALSDAEPNDLPLDFGARELFTGWGTAIAGTLEGTGWSDFAEPAVLEDAACGSSGTRAPESPGDYIADVDTFTFIPGDDGHLCARAFVGEVDAAFDLLLIELDSCGVPVDFVRAADTEVPIGQDLLGPMLDWGVPVRGGTRYSVQFAAFWPNNGDLAVPYGLGISLVPTSEGDLGTLCPLLPSEVE